MTDFMDEREIEEWKRQEKLKAQAPGLFSMAPKWVRYSRYEPVQDEVGNWYVVPAKNANMEIYKPFEHYPEILRDFLELKSKAEWDIRPRESFEEQAKCEQARAKAMIPFVERYGLLGLFWHYLEGDIEEMWEGENTPKHWKPYLEAGERALVRTRTWHGSIRDITPGAGNEFYYNVEGFSKYAKLFFPRSSPPPPDQVRPRLDQEKFSRGYGERVNEFAYAASDIWRMAKEWTRFHQGDFGPTDDYVLPDGYVMAGYRWSDNLSHNVSAWPVGMYLTHNGNWQLSWSFSSLLDALKIMMVLNLASEKQEVRLCFNCSRPFVAQHPKARCCNETCSNAYRQRKYRQGKNKKSKPDW